MLSRSSMFALKNTDKIATAFAPGNISCFFRVYRHINPRWTGSYGLGFTVNEGVIVSIKQAKTTSISFNSKPIVFPTVRYVIDHLIDTGVSVNITSPLPLGSGFGLSGASALATAYALNNLFKLRKTKKQLAILAHMAEVVNQTGLGDVVNQYFGGFLLKTKPSSYFKVQRLMLTNTPVYWLSFGVRLTKNTLVNSAVLNKIDRAGKRAFAMLENIKKKQPFYFGDLLDISYIFVMESGLLQKGEARQMIDHIRKKGGHASMIVIGNAVFSNKSFPYSQKLIISERAAQVI